MNSWPDGKRRALTPSQHEAWNASNYPGTRQLCCKCEGETGRCEEDSLYIEDEGPLCESCHAQPTNAVTQRGE
jgi:hypothetical protein